MWRVIAHCHENSQDNALVIKEFYVLKNDSHKIPWHRLVIVENGNIMAGDEEAVNAITEFRNRNKT